MLSPQVNISEPTVAAVPPGEFSPRDRTSDVVAGVLKACFGEVLYHLPLAATAPDRDVEYVHQLRVATRRALAAMKLFRARLGRRRRRRLAELLRAIRRAAGDARDYDVMIQRLTAANGNRLPQVIERLRELRAAAQAPIAEIHQQLLADDRLENEAAELVCRVRPRGKRRRQDERFARWARRKLRRSSVKFTRQAKVDVADLEELHQLRLRAKRLRYTLDAVAAAVPPEALRKACAPVKKLQRRLGDINDHATAQRHIGQWIKLSSDESETRQLEAMLVEEQQQLQAAVDQFSKWWTRRRRRQLRRRLSRLWKKRK